MTVNLRAPRFGHIHWDSKADIVDERAADPFLDAFSRHASSPPLQGLLPQLCIGFAALEEAAMSRQPGA
jgi:hypothetical protein